MKFNKIVYTAFTAALFSTCAAYAAPVTVSGGTINFEGQVVDAACSVATQSDNQTITLDQVKTSKLATPGQAAGQQHPFSISLEDCDTSVSANAGVTFNGQADAVTATALANTAGAGAATNVALQLYGPDGQELSLGTASSTVTLTDGENVIPFSVDYIATGAAATAGYVSSTATFNVNYS
ncbi:fimbrial protein [Buttiauxella sp. B2]|uniref:fimbrial protein n=1 Tax=Buttiauxella sp. B2 TaxID=2587812 RepID=UPI00111CF6EE|nr:fimbrial protein [Buttiauxella sp. B2]TNV17212.1 fimbrial protein [Buttiauxella sp. B2]